MVLKPLQITPPLHVWFNNSVALCYFFHYLAAPWRHPGIYTPPSPLVTSEIARVIMDMTNHQPAM